MSDTQVAAQPAQPQSLTIAEAAQKYAELTRPAKPVSDAARIMGQQGAKARAEARQAQAQQVTEQQPEEGEDTAPAPDAETTNELTPNAEQPDAEGEAEESDDSQLLDLGEGVTLPREEVRKSILRQADYTKKTMALADARKAAESEWSNKLTQLDNIVSNLEQKVGKPKSLKQLIADHGPIDAMEKLAEQEDEQSRLEAAKGIAQRQRNEYLSKALKERDRHLAESYNPDWLDESKRDAAYTELSDFALKRGASPEHLRQLTEPWMIEVLDLANKQIKSQAGAAKITKAVLEKPKVIKPGAKVSAQGAAFNQLQTAQANLKRSGSIADAVAVLRASRGQRG